MKELSKEEVVALYEHGARLLASTNLQAVVQQYRTKDQSDELDEPEGPTAFQEWIAEQPREHLSAIRVYLIKKARRALSPVIQKSWELTLDKWRAATAPKLRVVWSTPSSEETDRGRS